MKLRPGELAGKQPPRSIRQGAWALATRQFDALEEALKHLQHDQKKHGRRKGAGGGGGANISRDAGSGWKPSMTEAEAKDWAKGSAYKKSLYHYFGHAKTARTVANEGYIVSNKTNFGRVWGDGVYLSLNQQTAKMYEQWNYGSGAQVRNYVNIKRPLVIDARNPRDDRYRAYHDLARENLTQALGGKDAVNRAAEAAWKEGQAAEKKAKADFRKTGHKVSERDSFGSGYTLTPEFTEYRQTLLNEGKLPISVTRTRYDFASGVTRLAQEKGYDAIIIRTKNSDGITGGSQMLVFDPKNVTVVKE